MPKEHYTQTIRKALQEGGKLALDSKRQTSKDESIKVTGAPVKEWWNDPFRNHRQYYLERLANPELVERAIEVSSPEGPLFAVPVGGERKLGRSSVLYSQSEGERLLNIIKGVPGFENARLEPTDNSKDSLSLEWGVPSNSEARKKLSQAEIGRLYGYSEDAIARGPHGKPYEVTDPESIYG